MASSFFLSCDYKNHKNTDLNNEAELSLTLLETFGNDYKLLIRCFFVP